MSSLRINLLPHREAARKARKQQFYIYTALAFLTGLVLGGLWFTVEVRAVDDQEARNRFLKTETAKLDVRIKDIATLRTEIEALKSRQNAVETLQSNRNVAVGLFNELVEALPKGVSIASLRQEAGKVTVTGAAESNERVAEFIRNTSGPELMLNNPELVEVQSGAAVATPGDTDPRQRRAGARFSYALKLHLNQGVLGQALVAADSDPATGTPVPPPPQPASPPAPAPAS